LAVRRPDGVLLLVVDHHLVRGGVLAILVAHLDQPSRACTVRRRECIMEGMRMKAPAWVLSLPAPPAARLKLFCFSHAGGGASAYARWPSRVPGDVHVLPV